jgi:hypothetical protein
VPERQASGRARGETRVSGNIKASGVLQVANSAATCTSAADFGKFRYNPVNGKLQICKP